MLINPNTKISKLLKENPNALDAIVSITPKFNKLKNPILRKLMAARTSIAMASKIGGCQLEDFYKVLLPLGFEVDHSVEEEKEFRPNVPAYIQNIQADKICILDVRPTIEAGKDPLKDIMKAVKSIPTGGALKLINSFEPTPLIKLLEQQSYSYFFDPIDGETTETWFYKEDGGQNGIELDKDTVDAAKQGFEERLAYFGENIIEIDVRTLQMPLPMQTILMTLEDLPDGKALYVNHKRIPMFLLPELKDGGFDYRIKEIAEGDVKLLIFKK